MAFDYNTGRLIKSEELPGRTVCLVANSDVSVQASEIILENDRLYGKWNVDECDICIAKSNWYTQIWPISQCLSPFIPFANCFKSLTSLICSVFKFLIMYFV